MLVMKRSFLLDPYMHSLNDIYISTNTLKIYLTYSYTNKHYIRDVTQLPGSICVIVSLGVTG